MLLVAAPTAACGDPPTVAIDIAGENRPVWVSRIAEDGRIVEAGILYDGLVMPDRLTWSPDGD